MDETTSLETEISGGNLRLLEKLAGGFPIISTNFEGLALCQMQQAAPLLD